MFLIWLSNPVWYPHCSLHCLHLCFMYGVFNYKLGHFGGFYWWQIFQYHGALLGVFHVQPVACLPRNRRPSFLHLVTQEGVNRFDLWRTWGSLE